VDEQYVRISSVEELFQYLQNPGAVILCGGTDLVVKMRKGLLSPKTLLDISDLDELREIRQTRGCIEIGAAVTFSQIIEETIICEQIPILGMGLRKLGSTQIRNRGTIGGNLVNASPAADSAIPLLLLDAEVIIADPKGERRVQLEDFLCGPGKTVLKQGEFLNRIRIPIPEPNFSPFFYKVGRRKALTIAIASLGALLRMKNDAIDEIRLAAGSVAPVPLRLHRVETLLVGRMVTLQLIEQAKKIVPQCISPITDLRATADYRCQVISDLLARLLVHEYRELIL